MQAQLAQQLQRQLNERMAQAQKDAEERAQAQAWARARARHAMLPHEYSPFPSRELPPPMLQHDLQQQQLQAPAYHPAQLHGYSADARRKEALPPYIQLSASELQLPQAPDPQDRSGACEHAWQAEDHRWHAEDHRWQGELSAPAASRLHQWARSAGNEQYPPRPSSSNSYDAEQYPPHLSSGNSYEYSNTPEYSNMDVSQSVVASAGGTTEPLEGHLPLPSSAGTSHMPCASYAQMDSAPAQCRSVPQEMTSMRIPVLAHKHTDNTIAVSTRPPSSPSLDPHDARGPLDGPSATYHISALGAAPTPRSATLTTSLAKSTSPVLARGAYDAPLAHSAAPSPTLGGAHGGGALPEPYGAAARPLPAAPARTAEVAFKGDSFDTATTNTRDEGWATCMLFGLSPEDLGHAQTAGAGYDDDDADEHDVHFFEDLNGSRLHRDTIADLCDTVPSALGLLCCWPPGLLAASSALRAEELP